MFFPLMLFNSFFSLTRMLNYVNKENLTISINFLSKKSICQFANLQVRLVGFLIAQLAPLTYQFSLCMQKKYLNFSIADITKAFSELWQTSKMELFAKRLWIRLCIIILFSFFSHFANNKLQKIPVSEFWNMNLRFM